MCAGLILHAALDEQMVAENLGDGAVALEGLAAFAGFFGKAVEEIECRSVWIHRDGSGYDSELMAAKIAKSPQAGGASIDPWNSKWQSKPSAPQRFELEDPGFRAGGIQGDFVPPILPFPELR